MEPWQYYFAELQRRAQRIPPGASGRGEMLAEVAHDVYQVTANHLTGAGWDDEKALMVTRLFGQTVKEWIARGSDDWERLSEDLGRRYGEWTNHRGGE